MGRGNKGVRVSFVPLGGGSPLSRMPGYQVKRRTSFLFCGCGETASWRRPCPGAAEKEGDGELADVTYADIHSVPPI